jgi:hypothetical protein
MSDSTDKELLQAVNKLQWALGESIFRAEKLKTLAIRNGKIVYGFEKEINELLKTLTQISQLYRHDIAEKIKSLIPK